MAHGTLFFAMSNVGIKRPCECTIAHVEAERSYHQTVLATLEKLYDEMIMEKKRNESSSQPITMEKDVCVPTTSKDANSNGFDDHGHANQNGSYFIAKVIHPFDAQADGELGLSVDDYVVVRQRHLPISGPEGLHELKKIVERFEEKIYSTATSQILCSRNCLSSSFILASPFALKVYCVKDMLFR
ncbi:uncharacterized protein LOC104878063 [Vitis vinifera]|uniref:uncharacterized protein LOC104878063 n=1 Tax=Vitis vinifera TaxID=29760 RepID=UPI00288330A1|nr:uncharacterized protein LOC104878063 [Vitis vinifera]